MTAEPEVSGSNDLLSRSVTLPNLSLLRLDRACNIAPGNKSFKLQEYLSLARHRGVNRLVSFGGAWSNHLHALAGLGHQESLETVGIVRGEERDDTPMLADARRWGMRILRISRSEYRRRNEPEYQRELTDRLGPCVLVPEGGASVEGARGCAAIADMIRRYAPQSRRIVLPVGTGTTLAGLVACLDADVEVVGISALKGADDLEARIEKLLGELAPAQQARWHLLHEFHCGGFARVNAGLRSFIQEFEQRERIPLDPVYTGKMLFAIHRLYASGEWDSSRSVLAVHTGGLQGRRGFRWLNAVS